MSPTDDGVDTANPQTDGTDRLVQEGDILHVPKPVGWGHRWRVDEIDDEQAHISIERGPEDQFWPDDDPIPLSDLRGWIEDDKVEKPDQ